MERMSTRRCGVLRAQVWHLGGHIGGGSPFWEVFFCGWKSIGRWTFQRRIYSQLNEGTENSGKWPGNESLFFQLWKGEECKKIIFFSRPFALEKKKKWGKKKERKWVVRRGGKGPQRVGPCTIIPSSRRSILQARHQTASSGENQVIFLPYTWPILLGLDKEKIPKLKLNTDVSTCLKNSNESIKWWNSRLFDDLITGRPTRPAAFVYLCLYCNGHQLNKSKIEEKPLDSFRGCWSDRWSASRALHLVSIRPRNEEPVWFLWYQ